MNWGTKPGEIWKVDLGLAGKVRWFIVVSRHDPDAPRALTLGVPITTKYRGSAYEVPLGKWPCLREESFANKLRRTTAPVDGEQFSLAPGGRRRTLAPLRTANR